MVGSSDMSAAFRASNEPLLASAAPVLPELKGRQLPLSLFIAPRSSDEAALRL